MTNEQSVLKAEEKIAKLKQSYVLYLTPIATRISNGGKEPTLEELLQCQQLGAEYFNFVENFVGNSGLLGAHTNGKWVTGFAETCHSVLNVFITHANFLRNYAYITKGALQEPDVNAYANMQRMTKKYLQKEKWQKLEDNFEKNALPSSGFKFNGANDLTKTPKWQLITALAIGILFAISIFVVVIFIPNPTSFQILVFRGLFSISLAAIAAIIPGLLHVESRFQELSIRATGAIAVFILVWLVNPPALITG